MENIKRLLKVSSTINFILGVAVLFSYIYSAFFFALGFIFLIFCNFTEDELKRNKTLILVVGIITIPLNLITGILAIIASDKISSYMKTVNGKNAPPVIYKKVVDKEKQKIDILLKIGVGMVFLSGILFATTSWAFISNVVKVFALIAFGLLFVILSIFTESKLKLYKSSYMYWILGVSFFLLGIIAMLYFGVFGSYLTYDGKGRFLSFVITYFTVFGLSIATYLKYPKNYLLYVVYMSIILIITNIFKHFNIDNTFTIIVISTITFLINAFVKEDKTLSKFSRILSYLLFVFILKNIGESNELLILIVSLINILNLYFIMDKDDIGESIISLIITYTLLIASIYNTSNLGDYKDFLFFMLITLHTLFIKFNIFKVNKVYNNFNYIIYTFSSIIVTIASYSFNELIGCSISIIYLITNILLSRNYGDTNDIKYAKGFEPLSILLLIICVLDLEILDFDIDFSLAMIATTIIYSIIHLIIIESKYKLVYFVSIIIGIVLTVFSNYYEKNTLVSILTILPCLYLYISSIKEEKTGKAVCSYIALLLSIYNVTSIINILDLNKVLSSIIFAWIIIVFIILSKRDIIKKISYFAIILPIYDVIRYFNFDYDYQMIAISVMTLYITFLIAKLLCKDDTAKSIVGTIGIILSVYFLSVLNNFVVGIYIGIVGLIALLIGYFNKNMKPIFITGIIITVANIFIQLNNLWEEIPFWLYLLVGGLTLIGIVTYKEVSKNKEK